MIRYSRAAWAALLLVGAAAVAINTSVFSASTCTTEECVVVKHRQAIGGERIAPAQAPDLLRAIAADLSATFNHPYGVLEKKSGNNCGGIACDIICDATDHWDVFIDGPDADAHYAGTSQPAWQPKGSIGTRTCLLSPALPPAPEPTPDPGIPPVCSECPQCPPDQQQLVTDLQAQVQALTAERNALRTERDELLSRPEPTCEIANRFWRALGIGCRVVR